MNLVCSKFHARRASLAVNPLGSASAMSSKASAERSSSSVIARAQKRLKVTGSAGKQLCIDSSYFASSAQHGKNPKNSDDDGSQPQDSSATKSQLSPMQLLRMETNKALAKAKQLQKLCQEVTVEARGKGRAFPKLESLLVEQSWLAVLKGELQKPYMQRLSEFLEQDAKGGVPIYPPPNLVFNALNICPFEKIRVVILGQDPYHGPGQAMGLCFSVPKGIKMPPSLLNIFKEIKEDIGVPCPSHGNLERWAIQGVLLLNTVLTVREHKANSHAKKGWETFTDAVIRVLSLEKKGLIFILWGNSAQEKIKIINTGKHHILKAAHPSGLSAYKGFFTCRHFSETNKILEDSGLTPIDWQT